MMRALYTAATGMRAEQTNVDTIANNLSNVNTTGFKGQRTEFKSLLYQTIQTLMEMNPVAVARTSVNGAKLTAYENGYAVYEVDSAHTVMAVECCGDYRYDFTDGTHQIVPAETFEDAEWSLRLLMEGEKRMEHNLSKTAAKFEQVPLECDGSDWSTSIMVDFLDADNAEMLADRELRRLYAAMNKLTERQMEVVQLYFYKGMTQQEIAEEIGIGRRSGGNCLEGALKKIRKNF